MKAFLYVGRLALLAAVCLLVASPLAAQYGALEGVVKDSEGKILAGVQIVIERTDIRGHYETKTDKKGYYFYMGLPSGPSTRYRIQVIKEGQVLWQISDVTIPTGEYRRLDIDLAAERKAAEAQMTPEQKKMIEDMRKQEEKAKNLEDFFNLGMNYMRQRQYAEAVTQFEKAAEADPNQFAVWAQLGQAYSGMNRPEKAIEAYERSITIKPDEAGVYNNLGTLYARANRVDDAKRAFTKAAELDPARAATYYFNLGAILVNQGEMKAAAEPLKKSVELDPNRAAAYYWLGVSLYASADTKIEGGVVKTILPPGTAEAFQKYLELEPNGQYSAEARQNLELLGAQVPASVTIKKKK